MASTSNISPQIIPTNPGNGRSRKEAASAVPVTVPGLQVRFLDDKPSIFLSGSAIQATAGTATRRELIDRLFSIPQIESLRLNWKRGEVRLDFADAAARQLGIIDALSAAMLGGRPNSLPLPHEEVVLDDEASSIFAIRRRGAGLTLWQIEATSPRFFRLAHPLLRLDFVRKQVLDELATLADVLPRSLYLPLTGNESLIVFVRPHRVDPSLFHDVLDPVLTRSLASGPPRRFPKPRDVLVNSNLGIAVLADLFFPPLGLANITLMGLLGADYFRRGFADLRRGKTSLELLYLVIAGLSIVTYEFLPAAAMYWLLRYWPRRSQELYASHQTKFLSRYRLRPRRVWIDQRGVSLETRVEALTSSSVVTLTAGDVVPGDGLVVDGAAQVDEQLLTGVGAPIPKREGSAIYAASRIVNGSVRIKIESLGADTAAGRLAQWYDEALKKTIPASRVTGKAEKAVLPVLLVSALATLQGGLTLAKAVIRPDYVTGPAISDRLGSLAAVIRAANEGILISGNAILEKLTGPVSVVFDDTIAWETPTIHGETFSNLALKQGVDEVVFFSSRSQTETAQEAARLGFQTFFGDSSPEAKRAYIAQRQSVGYPVVYVGDILSEKAAAAQADVAIPVLEPPFPGLDETAVALLSPDLLKFLQLRVIAASSAENLDTAVGVSLVPNVAAVLSAFFLASPVWASIVLTNLGTLANFIRSETILHLRQSNANASANA